MHIQHLIPKEFQRYYNDHKNREVGRLAPAVFEYYTPGVGLFLTFSDSLFVIETIIPEGVDARVYLSNFTRRFKSVARVFELPDNSGIVEAVSSLNKDEEVIEDGFYSEPTD